MNIYYISAAIREATGVSLTFNQTKDALLAEGLITKQQYDKLQPITYDEFYGSGSKKVKELLETDKEKEIFGEESEVSQEVDVEEAS